MNEIKQKARKQAEEWLGERFDAETRREVQVLLDSDREDDKRVLLDSFYKDIDFGTGGVRGIMGVGTNRINHYTLAKVTQGLIRFASKNFPSECLKVAIAYDTRNNSDTYSREVAEIFAASGAEVYRFKEAMPTPLLSYAVRKLGCRIGIVITASHNPKEYNGYKVYFEDGGQVVPPWDKLVIEEVNRVEGYVKEETSSPSGRVIEIDDEVVYSYSEEIRNLIKSFIGEEDADFSIPLVFSSLHGTGGKLIVPLLKELGFSNLHTVPSQMEEDGNFSTVIYPNPEEKEALTLGIEMMEKQGADLLMATDPDSDRLGVAVRHHNGKPVILNGNQIGVLLADFVLSRRQKEITSPFLVRTIVTTPLIDALAESNGLEVFRVLTGFKYIGELIRKYEGKKHFLFGLEESHGYLATDKVRDKDGVSSALLFAVMSGDYKRKGMTVYDRLCQIYQKYGFCFEELASLTKTGPEGKKEIETIIATLRQEYGKGGALVDGEELAWFRDYGDGREFDVLHDCENKIDLPSSEVIQLETSGGTLVTIRPSGTEPKIKFYFSVRIPLSGEGDLFTQVELAETEVRNKIGRLKNIFVGS